MQSIWYNKTIFYRFAMKVDYEQYPEIPPNCQLNLNKNTNVYQVFSERRDPITKKVIRTTVGSIKDGIFKFGENYLLRQQTSELEKENRKLKSRLEKFTKQSHDSQKVENLSKEIVQKMGSVIDACSLDSRKNKRASVSMLFIALVSVMCALTGKTDAVSIEQYCKTHQDFFKDFFKDYACEFSHDCVRKNLMLIKPERFESFYFSLICPLLEKEQRVINVDGQAARATGRKSYEQPEIHGIRYLMNIYDSTNRVLLLQRLIGKKKNEISVGYQMISELNLSGCVVTADAMSCQVKFVEAVIAQGANYLLSLKGNQDKSLMEVQNLFHTIHSDHLYRSAGAVELDHGRIEQRTVEAISGRFLSAPLKQKWLGLEDGCIVKIQKDVEEKKTRKKTTEEAYYISSLPADENNIEKIGEIARSHWSIENRLHWILDMHWNQDRMQANNPNYIANRANLNKLALAFLENYRFRLWNRGELKELDSLSIQALQTRCANPKVALDCIADALGISHPIL